MLWEYQKEKGTETVLKTIRVKNIPNPGIDIDIQMHEAQMNPTCLIQIWPHQDTL